MWLDYDNDGDLDLYQVGAFFDNWYPNSVFINTDGQFSTENVFHVKGYYSELGIDHTACVATDFDQDGDQDIFSSGKYTHGVWNVASLLVNNGVKSIENTDRYRFSYNGLGIRDGSIHQGDFNKDGLMDYFLTGNSSSISSQDTPFSQLLFGTGDGNFFRHGQLLDVYNSSSDVGDIDNDGDLDILVSGQASAGPLTRIYLNDGIGVFSEAGTGLLGLSNCSVALADYDNDGDLDIFMTGRAEGNTRTTKLYRNDLLSKTTAPNQKPGAPSNLRFKMENNSLVMEWDRASDKETPAGSLSYNAYVGIEAKRPFKLFPQANPETGKRRVHEQGNASVNTRLTLKNLKTGTYYFSVQSIDGANVGSEFAPEVSFHYTRIDAMGYTCPGGEQVFSASTLPADYNWAVSGGTILEGQGTETVRVKWDKQPVNPRVTATTNGSSNSLVPMVQMLPSAAISGPTNICDMEAYTEFRPAGYSQEVSYQWNIDGAEFNNAFPYFEWDSPGNKIVTLVATDPDTGCTNAEDLQVAVSEVISVRINHVDGIYSSESISPTYTYKWEQNVNDNWSTVGTKERFVPTSVGTYRLTIANSHACTYGSFFYVNEIILGIEEQMEHLQVAPNPATTVFSVINLPGIGKPVDVAVMDMAGRNMFMTSTTDTRVDVNCTSFSRGIYIVVTRAGNEVKHSKVVIR